MPSTAYGKLKIVPSADLGRMGSQQGEATLYNWKWYYTASGWIIWLILILAIVIPKANHHFHIFWIAVPLVVLNQFYLAVKQLFGLTSSTVVQFDTLFYSMLIAVTVLWLTAGYHQKLGGAVRFFFSFGTILIVASLGTLPHYAGFSTDTFLYCVLFVVMTLALLLAMTMSRLLCRRRYKPVPFLLWLGLWLLLGSIVGIAVFYSVLLVGMGSRPSWSDLPQMIVHLTIPGLIFGLSLYMLNVPFLILGFAHPFFRERLCAFLSLKPKTQTGGSGAG